jgi:hypothetical protein
VSSLDENYGTAKLPCQQKARSKAGFFASFLVHDYMVSKFATNSSIVQGCLAIPASIAGVPFNEQCIQKGRSMQRTQSDG